MHLVDPALAGDAACRPRMVGAGSLVNEPSSFVFDRAAPMSPKAPCRRAEVVFKHPWHKDQASFPGPEPHGFGPVAGKRHRSTVALLDSPGIAEYEAVEAFVLWDGRALD